MMNTTTKNKNKSIDPYADRKSAILWLRNKGITVVDESTTYHSMSFRFIENGPTSKDIKIISSLGSIEFIDFATKTIHIWTSNNNMMDAQ